MDERTRIVTELAENRSAYFELVAQLEQETGLAVDTVELEAAIDVRYPGRMYVSADEAKAILTAAAV